MVKYQVVKHAGPANHDIPASLAREIGRFITVWAHFENYTQAVVWNCIGVGGEIGRISVREPRLTDKLDMIREVCEFTNTEADLPLLLEIKRAATPIAAMRHLLAHSIWTKHDDGEWYVLLTRGTWKQLQEAIPGFPKGSKAIKPEGVRVTTQQVTELRLDTERLLHQIPKIFDNNVPLPEPSPRKPRKRSAQAGPSRGQRSKTPKSPPRSSQG